MALFGPRAKLERCLWWAELTSWPNGANDAKKGRCYDKVFGRVGAEPTQGRQPLKTVATVPVKPKNDLLTVAVVIIGAFIIWKYVIK